MPKPSQLQLKQFLTVEMDKISRSSQSKNKLKGYGCSLRTKVRKINAAYSYVASISYSYHHFTVHGKHLAGENCGEAYNSYQQGKFSKQATVRGQLCKIHFQCICEQLLHGEENFPEQLADELPNLPIFTHQIFSHVKIISTKTPLV